MDKLYILVPVHNRRKVTESIVNSIQRQSYQNYHLILIDDGSKDGTVESIKSMVPAEQLSIIRGKGNWWWAGSLQKGFKWLKSLKNEINVNDYVLIEKIGFRGTYKVVTIGSVSEPWVLQFIQ